ncbi:PocR ligand-binding domain-containing protein [Vagococcus penaei]|nr:PocR ligand-binding domain-containing protein [Vagococcus penaei]
MTFELKKVLDLEKWEKVQESIAIATQLAIILVDYKGKPVTQHSQVQPFCQLARQTPELAKFCEKCDARGGLEAVRTGQPFIYRCHFDIIDMAIPIILNGDYVGAIMAGEIHLEDGHEQLEQVLTLPDNKVLQDFKLAHQDLYQLYPKLSLDDLKKSANMLERISEYIVSEAIKKDYLVNAYKHSLHLSSTNDISDMDSLHTESLEFLKKDIDATLLDQKLKTQRDSIKVSNQQLQPAIDYLYVNKSKLVSLNDLATITHLSPSYLSRLLKEELGESFQVAYIKLKLSWAKELLETTSLPVQSISDSLGYIDTSYFVRLFKKHLGVTPLAYRKLHKKSLTTRM